MIEQGTISIDDELNDYKGRLNQRAEALLATEIPATILRLNELLETPDFKHNNLNSIYQECQPPAAVANSSGDHAPSESSNMHLVQLIDTIKPHVRKLIDDASTLKMWISFKIPRCAQGHNLGVHIQEDTFVMLESVEADAASFFARNTNYFTIRARLLAKCYKNPRVDDYRNAVKELDQKQYFNAWMGMCAVRDAYCWMHDSILKNLDKLLQPRPVNAGANLYSL